MLIGEFYLIKEYVICGVGQSKMVGEHWEC